VEEKLLEFYASVYQQELDLRDSLLTRLQITAALLITNGSSLIYMLKNVDFSASKELMIIFYLLAGINVIFIAIASKYLKDAYSQSDYASIPSLQEIDVYAKSALEHNIKIQEYNQKYNTNEKELDVFSEIRNIYIKCASFNSDANTRRSSLSHHGFKFVSMAYAPLILNAAVFIIFDMDAASSRKPTEIEFNQLIEQISTLSNQLSKSIESSTKELTCQNTKNLRLLHQHLPHHQNLDICEIPNSRPPNLSQINDKELNNVK
jgi:hypothetical protein